MTDPNQQPTLPRLAAAQRMLQEAELEDAFQEAQEFAAIGEDVKHWEYLFERVLSVNDCQAGVAAPGGTASAISVSL